MRFRVRPDAGLVLRAGACVRSLRPALVDVLDRETDVLNQLSEFQIAVPFLLANAPNEPRRLGSTLFTFIQEIDWPQGKKPSLGLGNADVVFDPEIKQPLQVH